MNLIIDTDQQTLVCETATGCEQVPLDYAVADAGRLRALGWQPQVALKARLRRLVEVGRT